MIKNRNLINFILNYIFANKFIKFYLLFAFFIFIATHEIILSFLYQSSEILTWHKFSYIIYLVLITVVLSLVIAFSLIIFSSIKNNGVHLNLNVSAISRKRLFIIQTLVLFALLFLFIIVSSLSLIIISYIQKKMIFVKYYSFNMLILILLILIASPFIISFNIFFKGIISVVFSIFISLIFPSTFIISRITSSSFTHDNLSYKKDINYNNYALANNVDNQGNILSQKLVNIVEYSNENKNNNTKDIHSSINPVTNDSFRKFMIGDLLAQLNTDLLLKANIPKLSVNEIYNMSHENYMFNSSILNLTNYKTGEPNEISNKNNVVLIAYGDKNPLEMSYDDIFNNIDSIIKKENLKNKATFLQSIESKTNKLNSWSAVKFSAEEKSILNSFSGIEDNHWLFYLLKYKSLFNNKISKLYEDVGRKMGIEIKSFVEFLFKNDSFANNVTNFKTIFSNQKIDEHFPSIGILNMQESANNLDIDYFKNNLIHFSELSGKFIPKILTSKKSYEEIKQTQINNFIINKNISNFTKIQNALTNKEKWDEFIDANQEVSNLKEIYSVLYSINSRINPEYVFQNNGNDIYEINKVLLIKNNKWISASIAIVFIFISISLLLLTLSYKLYKKIGGLYV